MASTKKPRPGRTLTIFLLLVVALGAWAFWPGVEPHSPRLGLDLQGGTQVTLIPKVASGSDTITQDQLEQTVGIIRQRVNGLGVAEAEVTTQGSGAQAAVVVSVPGVGQQEIANQLKQTALLDFRPVENVAAGVPDTTSTPVASTTVTPGTPTPAPTATPGKAKSSKKVSGSAFTTSTKTTKSGVYSDSTAVYQNTKSKYSAKYALNENNKVAYTQVKTKPKPTPTPAPTPTAPPAPVDQAPPIQGDSAEALTSAFSALDCSKGKNTQGGTPDDPSKWIVTCSTDGTAKYLLQPAFIRGTQITDAQAALPQTGGGGWQVNLTFDADGTKALADVSTKLSAEASPKNQFAIVLDGLVQSSPYFKEPILGGTATISGNFTIDNAKALAQVLKYGALPINLEVGEVTTISPTLGSDYLRAGLLAGALGLLLVVLFLLLYYRYLGVVAITSLVVAGIVTYSGFIVLGRTLGLALTLAGISGAIVAIGITADSFIVYFERIRDEVRDGKTIRAAGISGWMRAKKTILAADFISILAAGILYYLSIGNVRGFAFVLGLTTIIDVIVAFWFTRPLIAVLSRSKRFASGKARTGLNISKLQANAPAVQRVVRVHRKKNAKEPKVAISENKQTLSIEKPTTDVGEEKEVVTTGNNKTLKKEKKKKEGFGQRLYSGSSSFNIVGRRKLWYAISAVILLAAIVGLSVRGLNMGIEFKGGAEFDIPASTCTVDTVRDVVAKAGQPDAVVTTLGSDRIRVQTPVLETQAAQEISKSISTACQVGVDDIKVQLVGPTWGSEITQKALMSLFVFLIAVTLFLASYFEWRMAAAALVALLHDLVITIGIYALVGFEVTPATIIGFLTILGFSLYDTVVVFDKVRENTSKITGQTQITYSEAANLALNQTVVRSINTSIVAILPVAAILFIGAGILGAGTLKDLALALLLGMAAGMYSSIFVATPLLCQFKERQSSIKELKAKVLAYRERAATKQTPVSVVESSDVVDKKRRTTTGKSKKNHHFTRPSAKSSKNKKANVAAK